MINLKRHYVKNPHVNEDNFLKTDINKKNHLMKLTILYFS